MSVDIAQLNILAVRAQQCLQDDGGALWGPVAGRWMFCCDHDWYFTEQVTGGELVDGLWRIDATGGATANAAYEWDGRWWAQISFVSPAGVDMDVLMLHELWHATVQKWLLTDETQPDADGVLETVDGRTLFFAEVEAWLRAVDDQSFLADALALRTERRRTTPAAEWERQRQLELAEGLAEYSGIVWAKAPLS